MTIRTNISIFLLLALAPILTLGQNRCDTVKIYDSKFDQVFQEDFQALNSDTIFTFRHCASSNGCSNSIGLIVWKKDQEFQYKTYKSSNSKVKVNDKPSKALKHIMTEFLDEEIYQLTTEIEGTIYYIDDGPLTFIAFKTKSDCWFYDHLSTTSKDKRVTWTEKLLSELRK